MTYRLSEEAAADVHEIIGWVVDEHGQDTTLRLFEALDEKFEAIGAGWIVGHIRRDVPTARATSRPSSPECSSRRCAEINWSGRGMGARNCGTVRRCKDFWFDVDRWRLA